MKKTYVVPESKLIAINLKESIAVSGGVDHVDGSASITFTSQIDGCRDFYTRFVPVKATGTGFLDYYNDFRQQVNENMGSIEYLSAWFACYSGGF